MIRSLVLALVAALSIGLSGAPASAQSVTDAQKGQIQARIDELSALISQGDLVGAIDVVPPRLQDAISTRFGIPRDQIKSAMRQAMGAMLDQVQIDRYGMDLAAARTLTTPTGGRTYLLIPTFTEMTVQGAKYRSDTQTLAMADDGQWYLIRVEDAPQQAILRDVYPEFVGVDFPAGATRQLP
ncbi:hypothetical protein [Brevundimonas sp. GCM10030266]|uniref:hypothetical protein n=1 Tax=Brevundimonas sp. GCM10030266 TaxID=3273386 RepID=UPI00361B4DD8